MEASRATTAPSAFELGGVRQVVADYVTLTKPKVQLLLLLTTITTMYVAGDPSVGLVAITVVGGFLSAGGAAVRLRAAGRVVRRARDRGEPAERVPRPRRVRLVHADLHGLAQAPL